MKFKANLILNDLDKLNLVNDEKKAEKIKNDYLEKLNNNNYVGKECKRKLNKIFGSHKIK